MLIKNHLWMAWRHWLGAEMLGAEMGGLCLLELKHCVARQPLARIHFAILNVIIIISFLEYITCDLLICLHELKHCLECFNEVLCVSRKPVQLATLPRKGSR